MDYSKAFEDYLAEQAELIEEGLIKDLLEWLMENGEPTMHLMSTSSRAGLGSQDKAPLDTKNDDPNTRKKSKSEDYKTHIMKLQTMLNANNLAEEGRLDAAMRFDKKRKTEREEAAAKKKNRKRVSVPRKKGAKGGKANIEAVVVDKKKKGSKKPAKKGDAKDEKKSAKKGGNNGKNFVLKGSNKEAAVRFIKYKSANANERKYPAPRKPVQSGRIKGKVDGDIAGRFARYYGEKGEAIRHAVAHKIANGTQNMSGLQKGWKGRSKK
jgi:hypothetical protein